MTEKSQGKEDSLDNFMEEIREMISKNYLTDKAPISEAKFKRSFKVFHYGYVFKLSIQLVKTS